MKIKIFDLPASILSILIFFGYFLAIFNLLPFSNLVLLFLMFYITFTYILNIKKFYYKNIRLSDFYILLYLLPLMICIHALGDSFRLSKWDEFGNWAINVKYMILTDQLYSFSKLEYFTFKHYTPAQQIFQYLILKNFGWSEYGIIVAQFVLLFSCLISIFSTERKNLPLGGLALISSTTIIYYYHYSFNSIYSDSFLAFYFAMSFIYIIKSDNSLASNLFTWIFIFILGLIKQSGLVFQVILFFVYFLKQIKIFFYIDVDKNIVFKFNGRNNKYSIFKKYQPYWNMSIMLSSIMLSYGSWKIFLKSLSITANPPIPSFIKFFESPLSDKAVTATHLFILKLNEAAFNTNIKLYKLILAYTVVGLILSTLLNNKNRFFHACSFLAISIGCIVYFLFLLFAYIVFFGPYEGPLLYGIERYTATYFIAWSLILLGYFVNFCLRNIFNKALLICVSGILLMIIPPVDFYKTMWRFPVDQPVLNMRGEIDSLARDLDGIPSEKKVYFISQNTSGYEARVFQYTISPRQASNDCWSVGSKYGPSDLYTCSKSFEDLISGYDYLAIYKSDEKFWNEQSRLFSKSALKFKANGIYKVNLSKDGLLMIEPLQN